MVPAMSNFSLFDDLPETRKDAPKAEVGPVVAPAPVVQTPPAPAAAMDESDTSLAGKNLYLIDGSGFIFRAFHSMPPLTNPEGTPVGAVYGFINMMMKVMEGNVANYMAVIFDAARQTFRNELYPAYKANRGETPEELIPQFPLVRAATQALNLPGLELAGYEADDLIATYARQAEALGMNVTIISSDKDLMQLVSDNIQMWDAMKQKHIRAPEVLEKFGVPPEKVGDVLALMGDSSDNIPGAAGIGPKTAAELINEYGDLETLLARAGEIKQNKRRETIQNSGDIIRLSRKLVALHEQVPVPMPLTDLRIQQPDPQTLQDFLIQQGFKSLVARARDKFNGLVSTNPSPASAPSAPSFSSAVAPAKTETAPVPSTKFLHEKYQTVSTTEALHGWLNRALAKGMVAFDTETTWLDAMRAELVGFSLALGENDACYVPLAHVNEFGQRVENQLALADILPALKAMLEDPRVLKIGQNMKYDAHIMARHGVEIAPFDDTMLLSYSLHGGEHGHGMDDLSARYLSHAPISFKEVVGSGKSQLTFAQVPLDKATAYAAEDADVTWRLHQFFKPELRGKQLTTVYETLERPLVPVLSRMERVGVKVDAAQLVHLSKVFAEKLAVLETDIFALAGREFNIGSPKQLGEVMFDEMKLPGGKKSKTTGQYATHAEALEELAEAGHALPAKVLEWRGYAKLRSTYTESLQEQINPDTGRVHTSFHQAAASTGRLSSSDPNVQNIPIRTEEGRMIRHAFVAAEGWQFLSADYSQIELRLLADMADMPSLRDAFKAGHDIHAATASEMFGVPLDQVSSELRRNAKMINFGIIYGISAHGLATRLGIERHEAADYIKHYFAKYPGIQDYMERMKTEARQYGFVKTLFGRQVHVPGIHDSNGNRRAFAERQAINAPLQGTAADIIKRAMITLDKELAASGLQARMLLQVHDELLLEVRPQDALAAQALVKKVMEGAAHLSVPLTVETAIGQSWGEVH